MDLNLNYEGFEENLFQRDNHSWFEGIQYIFKFDNGYGASVIKHFGSYGHEKDLWELAVVEFRETGSEISHHLCYDTPITDDVIGYLTDREIREYLQQIKDLSMDKAEEKSGRMTCKYFKPEFKHLKCTCKAFYELEGCACGGPLHILLDESNIEDEHIAYCLDRLAEEEHHDIAWLGSLICAEFLKMPLRERSVFDCYWNEYEMECSNPETCDGCELIQDFGGNVYRE